MRVVIATLLLLVVVGCCAGMTVMKAPRVSLEARATEYLLARNAREEQLQQDIMVAYWNYQTNINAANLKSLETAMKYDGEQRRLLWTQYVDEGWPSKWKSLNDFDLKRQFGKISTQGKSALTAEKLAEFDGLVTDMSSTYGTAKVNFCVTRDGQTNCTLSGIEPELTNIMAENRNYDELLDAWVSWRDLTGKVVKDKFIRYVELRNEIAEVNNFKDGGDMWRDYYESPNFPSLVAALWDDLRPLYQQLHAYVRRKLRDFYGADKISSRGPIPAHLFGNMWAETWVNIVDIVRPYPSKTNVDVGEKMKEQGYTPRKMFEISNTFFKELNLTEMSPSFWDKSLIEKPPNREMVCHASAWDFYRDRDFRIKMCTTVTLFDLITVHHEMGHIEYDEQYRHQPFFYRDGANPAFHEAIGDTLALSVQTPKHLLKIDLLDRVDNDEESEINYLMKMALERVAFLPFGYLVDHYRWDVFRGDITSNNLNCKWWDQRLELQGLKPPVRRTENDFDPGSKFHVAADVPYIRYFLSFILQFQFHKTLCEKAGQYDPTNQNLQLHNCDIDQSKEAGNALASMLKMGSSRPWPDALEKLTGSRDMDASVILEYFKPLHDWLITDNANHDEHVGWEKDGDSYCV